MQHARIPIACNLSATFHGANVHEFPPLRRELAHGLRSYIGVPSWTLRGIRGPTENWPI